MLGHFKIAVTVSQEDMTNGRTRDPYFCPISLAIRRSFGFRSKSSVSVGIASARVQIATTYVRSQSPAERAEFHLRLRYLRSRYQSSPEA